MRKMKIGDYEPRIQEKGLNEAFIDAIKEGEPYWTIRLDEFGNYDTETQDTAIIISKLVKIENMLEKLMEKEDILLKWFTSLSHTDKIALYEGRKKLGLD